MKKKQKKKIERTIIKILMIVFVLAIMFSVFNIIKWYTSLKSNNEIKKIMEEVIDIEKIKEDDYKIDFEYLKSTNSDIVAYIEIDNTKVDYVVVKGKDNEYYLNHNINKEYNVAGWIFMDYKNKLDGNDKNIVIYGHNMADDSMFGSLTGVLKKEWYENVDNHTILLITENEKATYQIFSIYSIVPEDYYINTEFNDEKEYVNFLNKIKSRSIYNYDIELNTTDQILTLSTCNLSGDKRIVIHAKKMNSIID